MGASRTAQTVSDPEEDNAMPSCASWCRVRGEALIVGTVLWRRLVASPGSRCFRGAFRGQRLKGRGRVMLLAADRTMKGMRGGRIGMQSLETQCDVQACPDVRTGRVQEPLEAVIRIHQQAQVFQGKEAPHPVDAGCGSYGGGLGGENGGVDSVHTFGFEPGRTGAGLARIPYVSAGVRCFRGLEPGSSPTSGTVFSLFRGF
jgi:hypothetical protein